MDIGMENEPRSTLPQLELCAQQGSLPYEKEIRYKGFTLSEGRGAMEDSNGK